MSKRTRALKFLRSLRRITAALINMVSLSFRADPYLAVGQTLLVGVQGLMPLASAWVIKILFDRLVVGLQGGMNYTVLSSLGPVFVAQVFLHIAAKVIGPASSFINAELERKLTLHTQIAIHKKTGWFAGIAYFENPEFYDTVRLASMGATFGPIRGLNTITSLAQNLITLLGFLGILLSFNKFLVCMVIITTTPQLWTQLKFSRQRFGIASSLSTDERRAAYFRDLLSNITPAQEIRLFGLADFFLDHLRFAILKTHRARRVQGIYELRQRSLTEVFSALVSSVVLIIVILRAFTMQISLGDVSLYTNAVNNLLIALSVIASSLSNLGEDILYFTRYQKLMAFPQPIAIAASPRPVPRLRSEITLCNVSFRYTNEQPWILRDINLHIPAGKCLALVGPNGAGKTTIVKLLARFYDPTVGQIFWDGIDIREFDPRELRRRLGVVTQEFMKYDLTVQENIGLGNIKHLHDMDRIRQAANDAGIHGTIKRLPQGYKTIISRMFASEGTVVDLSGGEWQKIAIARMFMCDANFLILDEPTASLDAESEYEVYSSFVQLVEGQTCIVISHRFSTVRMADVVAVVEGGEITEYGSHSELLAQGRTYARLFNMQAARYS